jgi:hypothetical protein
MLRNLRIVRHDAVEVLTSMIAPGSLAVSTVCSGVRVSRQTSQTPAGTRRTEYRDPWA